MSLTEKIDNYIWNQKSKAICKSYVIFIKKGVVFFTDTEAARLHSCDRVINY